LNAAPGRSETTAPHPILAREGWGHVAVALALALGVHVFAGWVWALPFWLLLVFVLQFFRDPTRMVPQQEGALVCPADGRVIAVGPARDPYLERQALRVSIFMNVFNVHSNRSPVAGVVQKGWYNRGSFVNAALDKASLDNERNALWVKTQSGADVTVVQVAGLIARRILCYVKPGDVLGRGQRYGFIRFGSRVDVYMPPNAQLKVALGDKVKAARDIMAVLPFGA